MKRLTDASLKALLKNPPTERVDVQDVATSGLKLRVGPEAVTWSLLYRVKGEGGVSARGFKKRGKRHRLTLGSYPELTLEAARAKAQGYLDQAARGIDPAIALERAATAGGLTVELLSKKFLSDYVDLKRLRSKANYIRALDTHIIPSEGSKIVDLLTRADARELIKRVSVRVSRGPRGKDRPRGGTEAARTVLGVFRKMINWGIKEDLLTREDNPFEGMEENLPRKRRRERVLSVEESQIVWAAASELGYPFGPAYQLLMVSACRESEWGEAQRDWISLPAALCVIPAADYKSDHVHVVPLVPVAVSILQDVFDRHTPGAGPYIFSGTNGRRPIRGWPKAQQRLMRAMSALTGEKTKDFTPHDIRRTVATRAAEKLGYEGERLVKRVLGHGQDKKDVTLIYNRYGYVKEMRAVLTELASDLLRYYDPTPRLVAGNQILSPKEVWVSSRAA